jgi:hypothetical protein
MRKIYSTLVTLFLFVFMSTAADGFYVSGSKLKDANGNDFIIRGINNPHIWFDTDSYNALPAIAGYKVNCVRIVWQTNGSVSRLDQIVQKCIDLKMIPMVELHDATGKDSYSDLERMCNYWLKSDVKALISKYKKYIMVNIANEYGNKMSEWQWKEDYKKAITKLRNGGIDVLLVIDAPGYGQNPNGPLWYGQTLLDHDPLHNLLFGVHMYGSWNDSQKIYNKFGEFKSKNLPFFIGEYGFNYNNGDNNLGCKVDHKLVMSQCEDYGVGYMAWSWNKNSESNAWLDMTTDWNTLNWWGNEVINGTDGIKNTANTCSVFSTTSTAPIGKTISIKANTNGKFVCADKYLGSEVPLVANRPSVGSWEKFDIVDAGGGYVALKAQSNGMYVCADVNLSPHAPLVANRTKIGGWEKFQWIDAGSGYFALKAASNGKYVCADWGLGTHAPLVANRNKIGSWEKFQYDSNLLKSSQINEQMSASPENSTISVFPNPSVNGEMNVKNLSNTQNKLAVLIYDANGKLVFNESLTGVNSNGNAIKINHGLSSGVYIYQITNGVESIKGKLMVR